MSPKKWIFTYEEKALVKRLVDKYNGVVENKNCDRDTISLKQETWKQLTDEYNSNSKVKHPVSVEQLRRLWHNMKAREMSYKVKMDRSNESYNLRNNTMVNVKVESNEEDGEGDIFTSELPDVIDNFSESPSKKYSKKSKKSRPSSNVDDYKLEILEKEYEIREQRAQEIHELQRMVLEERWRKAKAEADLAERLLKQNKVNEDLSHG